jgi:hypothetical protein
MTRKLAIAAAIAALTVAASAAPAFAQVGFSVGYNDGWGRGGYGYNDRWGWNDGWRGGVGWGYDSYSAAAPGYGCTCAGGNYYSTYAPRYRSYARTEYPVSGYYADYGYPDRYYDRSYATVGVGWSDGNWRDDGWRDRSWREDRRGSVDRRVRTSARVNFEGDNFRGGARVRSRASDDSTRISANVRTNGDAVTGRAQANGNGRSRNSVRARVNTEAGR